jgi:hypothetical protein
VLGLVNRATWCIGGLQVLGLGGFADEKARARRADPYYLEAVVSTTLGLRPRTPWN